MPINAGIYELSRRLSGLIRRVEETGDPVVIWRHRRPVALLVPATGPLMEEVLRTSRQEFAEELARLGEQWCAGEQQ